MSTRVLAALFVFALAATAFAQVAMGDLFQLGRRGRLLFPSPSATTQGALLVDQDAGVLYLQDGFNWQPVVNVVSSPTGLKVAADGGLVTINTAGPSTLSSVFVNAVTVAATTYGGEVLPDAGFVVTAARFRVSVAGSGGTTDAVFRATDGVSNCDCPFACNQASGNKRVVCAGSCSFGAGAPLTYSFNSIGDCVTGPTVLGTVAVEGNWQ